MHGHRPYERGVEMTLTALDKLEIQELTSKYAMAMDDGDAAAWLANWTKEGIWQGALGHYEGLQQLHQLFRDLSERLKGKRHVMANFVISGASGDATQRCYMLIVDKSGNAPPMTAVYDDHVVRSANKWLFAERKVQIDQPAKKV
jgi:hypothetical protein